MASVALENISKRFGSVAAIDDVSITVAKGEFVTLLGPSGCGKTTLLRTVAGLVTPDSGAVRVDDADITRVPPHARDLAMVFQSPSLFPHMSVESNVAFGLRMRGIASAPRAREALTLMRMADFGARYPSQLSGGQQQRVAIARALVIEPRVLLMDEPFSALDRSLREAMQVELAELTRRLGITVIFVTHDQEEALVLSDRVAVMRDGRIEQFDRPAVVFERPATRFVASFMGVGNVFEATVTGTAEDHATFDIGGVQVRGPRESGSRCCIGIRAERIAIVAPDAPDACVTGRVNRVVYQGSMRTLTVATSGPPFIVRTTQREIELGAAVGLAWSLHDVLALA